MGKRDDRLRSPAEFQQILKTRPVSRSGAFVIYQISCEQGPRLGFVLPKKLVRTAVCRNQIKRWARALFRHPTSFVSPESSRLAMVVRVNTRMTKEQFKPLQRDATRFQLFSAMKKAFQNPSA